MSAAQLALEDHINLFAVLGHEPREWGTTAGSMPRHAPAANADRTPPIDPSSWAGGKDGALSAVALGHAEATWQTTAMAQGGQQPGQLKLRPAFVPVPRRALGGARVDI